MESQIQAGVNGIPAASRKSAARTPASTKRDACDGARLRGLSRHAVCTANKVSPTTFSAGPVRPAC
eukprot:3717552-Lingulodinium_polyedra.AAC.1